jgi:hypothetical protein
MNKYIQIIKNYLATRNRDFIIGTSIVAVGVIVIAAIAIYAYNSVPKVVYQPAKACELLSLQTAKELLGAKAINSTAKDPELARSGNTATSECGYTDGTGDTENMLVAAISVRSGVNDEGVALNKKEFSINKSGKAIKSVKDLGDDAYYNESLGQLNILDGRKWIILNYGVGSAPQANTIEQAIELANEILPPTASTSDL